MDGDLISSTHPPLPPTTEDNRFNCLRLLRSRRVGISTYNRLLKEHGSATAALDALPHVAQAAGVRGYEPCPRARVEEEMRNGERAGARLILRGDPDYPSQFNDIDDAPPLFWALGDTSLATRRILAIVGARNASSLGTRMAKKLAEELGEAGFVIASGLARGIDAAAHSAAMTHGTIGVQAGGVDVVYPAENAALFEQIARTGLRLSEQPMGLTPHARHFPARNRVISALSEAVIVVEAAARSGSLITARTALDQGRDVMAIPGHPFDGRASGCNMLIRDGAALIRGARDVIEALPEARTAATHTAAPETAPEPARRPAADHRALHEAILGRLGPAPVAEDQLLRDIGAPAQATAPALLELELAGRIGRDAGGLLRRLS